MSTQQGPDRTDRRDEKEARGEEEARGETDADRRTHTDPEPDARYEPDEPEGADGPLPRDPQNQQAEQGEDPLAIPVPDWPDSAAPETDVAGTGRRGDADDTQHENPDVDEPVD
ncbi:hypothetical protein PV371_33260 [Streptomyces sp. TX20-6-3]|uniref:hypothetical protein n=1 Tax=Streptomyces sp. TX20-6-3 TaxID=3028705 RepID=UPI0029B4F68A|nr:hypothetical protein [Streptomyces sp. TX20-6-3]MDX2564495.1 hypothetical protein [Streptomyces sp. TX20-6-3]